MLLQPRFFKYKKRQKDRSCMFFKNNKYLNFGFAGLKILKPVHLTSGQLFKFKLFLKRSSKKTDSTKRSFWFNTFPHIPLTRKPENVRMGKGKGKLECWFTNISGGTVLVEFRNLRKGRSIYFMKQMTHKLGIPTKYLFNSCFYFTFPISFSKRAAFQTFW